MWTTIVIIFLVLGIITFTVLYSVQVNKNYKNSSSGQLLPFSGMLGYNSTTSPGGTPINLDGSLAPQLMCPPGKTINIVGAYYQTVDPFQVCSNNPSPYIQASCIPGQGVLPCTGDGSCQPGYECVNGKCSLKAYSSLSAAQTDLNAIINTMSTQDTSQSFGIVPVQFKGDSNWYLLNPTMCGYGSIDSENKLDIEIPTTISNPVCSPGGSGRCAIRDCSAYLADKYNGKSNAVISIGDAGPFPCSIPVPDSNAGCNINWTADQTGNQMVDVGGIGSQYCQLPLTTGSTSNPNNLASTTNWTPRSSFNLGYYVHGLYTCE